MNAPEDYRFIGEVLQSAVDDQAAVMERDYLDALSVGEGQNHELHSDALQASQEAAIATRRDDIANTDQGIEWLNRLLQNPLLSSSERETLEGQLKTLQSTRKGHQAARQEAVDHYRGQLSQAAHEKAEAELGQFDSYEFWGGDSDESTQAVASGYPAPAPETRVGLVQPTPQPQRAGIPRQLRPGFPAFPPPVPEQRVGLVSPNLEPAAAPAVEPPQPVITPPTLRQGFPPAARPAVPQRQAGFNFPIEPAAAPAPEAAPALPQPPSTPPAPEKVSAPAARELTEVVVPPKPEAEDTKEAKAFQIETGFVYEPVHDEDRMIVDEERGLFAVFDGVGGQAGAALASEIARARVKKYFADLPETTFDAENIANIQKALARAHHELVNDGDAGLTTAVVTKLFTDNFGIPRVAWAAIGDSRLYKMNEFSGSIQQISKDEGFNRFVTNILGAQGNEVVQTGVFEFSPGDNLILCSDGITGDTEEQLLSDEEVRNAVIHADSPEMAAKELARISRKRDDTTAIVVRNTATR